MTNNQKKKLNLLDDIKFNQNVKEGKDKSVLVFLKTVVRVQNKVSWKGAILCTEVFE